MLIRKLFLNPQLFIYFLKEEEEKKWSIERNDHPDLNVDSSLRAEEIDG